MPGPTVDLTNLVSTLQQANQIANALLSVFQKGLPVSMELPSYTVATLPVTAAAGTPAWASNGRKAGEGAGVGTGVPVYFNTATASWFTFSANVVVTA